MEADIAADPSSLTNLQRAFARKRKVSAATINRILNRDPNQVAFREVRTCLYKQARAEKRPRIARQITKKIDSAKRRLEATRYSDESWADSQGGFNPRNERFFTRAGAKGAGVEAQDARAAP